MEMIAILIPVCIPLFSETLYVEDLQWKQLNKHYNTVEISQ